VPVASNWGTSARFVSRLLLRDGSGTLAEARRGEARGVAALNGRCQRVDRAGRCQRATRSGGRCTFASRFGQRGSCRSTLRVDAMTDMPVVRVALAGDTMLGRAVADRIAFSRRPPFAAEVVAAAAEADLFIVNLECCISARGARWPAPGKAFLFRAPPLAAELLAQIGVDCVTLANNHALDYGSRALLDTLAHLRAAGIACVGADADETAARAPHRLRVRGLAFAAGRL
jgi:hypothetical protein